MSAKARMHSIGVFGAVNAYEKSGARSLAFCEGRDSRAGESGAEVMKANTLAVRSSVLAIRKTNNEYSGRAGS